MAEFPRGFSVGGLTLLPFAGSCLMSQRLPSDSQARAAQGSCRAALLRNWGYGCSPPNKATVRPSAGLAQQYQRQCAAVALRLLGNTHDAAELVQDALLKAFKNLQQLQQSERFGPWLMRIVTNLALNFRRAAANARRFRWSSRQPCSEEGEDLRATVAGSELDAPERPLTSAELGDALCRSIDGLPEKQLSAGDVRDRKNAAERCGRDPQLLRGSREMARLHGAETTEETAGQLCVTPGTAGVPPAANEITRRGHTARPKGFMQQADNQHLDFLISQYVDGTLEGSGKKSVEQKLLTDPGARCLYAEHREDAGSAG